MFKNIICFYSFFYFPKSTYGSSRRESWWGLKCARTHTHTHTHTGASVRFFCETFLLFCFVLPGSTFSLVYRIFRTPTQSSLSNVPPTRCTWTRLLSSMPHMQLTRHFRWGDTFILVTLGNRCTSCCTTNATYVAFPLGHHPVYFGKHVYILLRSPRNLCDMSKKSFGRYQTGREKGKKQQPWKYVCMGVYRWIYVHVYECTDIHTHARA